MAFDIRADVAEVPRSEGEEVQPTVAFTFDLKLAKRVKELRAADPIDDAALTEAEAELESVSYVADLMSVPRRRREDIYEKSLDLFPAKPSMFGTDEKAQFLRGKYVRVEIVAAAIKAIHSPSGEVNDTEDTVRDTITYIHDEAPDQIFEVIERAVNKLNDEEDEQDALHKSADF